jgi:hypothetical protein
MHFLEILKLRLRKDLRTPRKMWERASLETFVPFATELG